MAAIEKTDILSSDRTDARRSQAARVVALATTLALGAGESIPAAMDFFRGNAYQHRLGGVVEPSLETVGVMVLRMPGSYHQWKDGTYVAGAKAVEGCRRMGFTVIMGRGYKGQPDAATTSSADLSIRSEDSPGCGMVTPGTVSIHVTSPGDAAARTWSVTNTVFEGRRGSEDDSTAGNSQPAGLAAATVDIDVLIQYAREAATLRSG